MTTTIHDVVHNNKITVRHVTRGRQNVAILRHPNGRRVEILETGAEGIYLTRTMDTIGAAFTDKGGWEYSFHRSIDYLTNGALHAMGMRATR